MKKLMTIVWVILFSIRFTNSQNSIPVGGQEVLGSLPMNGFNLVVNSGNAFYKKVDVTGQSFAEAAQLSTIQRGNNMWDIQWSSPSKLTTEIGDVMFLSFYARMISTKDETGQGTVGCVFEKNGPDYEKSLYRIVHLDKEWKLYNLPFTMIGNYLASEAQLNFQISTDKAQVIEIAEVKLLNFKNKVKKDDLPKTEYTYVGREPDAPWRKIADANIEKYRKSDIQLVVVNQDGLPVPELEVSIEMVKHSFGWGTAVEGNTFLHNEKYRTEFYRNFNKMVFENNLKWPEWNKEDDRKIIFRVLDSLALKGITARGHCLVWPGWRWLPMEMKRYQREPLELQKQIMDHINDVVPKIGNRVVDWDVLNEPYTNTDVVDICGKQVMIDWFTETKKLNSTAKLYINDFAIIESGGMDVAHQDHYYNTIKYLKDNNAPVEGIGFQSHFAGALTSPEIIWKILDRFAELGLDMQVTEFDIDTDDENFQAEYTRDFMTAIFAHPSMRDFIIWGFYANNHWKPNAAMYRGDWSEKPNLKIWRELIFNKWWTKESLKTNQNGKVALRGFLGDYTYTVKNKNGEVISKGNFKLDEKGFNEQLKVKY